MKKRLGAALLAGMMLFSVGCFNVNYVTDKPVGETKEGSNSFFLFGLVGDKTVDAKSLCPSGTARLTIKQSFVDGLLGTLTIGIYTPRSYKIVCARSGGAQ